MTEKVDPKEYEAAWESVLDCVDGMEITQFTYFQQMAGFECKPVSVEITYGLERICMFTQKEKIHSELIQYSRSKWDEGCDIVIMGHYHHSFNFNENQKELIICFI